MKAFGDILTIKNYNGIIREAKVIGVDSDGVVTVCWLDTGATGCIAVEDTII